MEKDEYETINPQKVGKINKNYKTEKMRSPRVEEDKNNDLKIKTKDLKSAKSSKQMQTSPKSNLNKGGKITGLTSITDINQLKSSSNLSTPLASTNKIPVKAQPKQQTMLKCLSKLNERILSPLFGG